MYWKQIFRIFYVFEFAHFQDGHFLLSRRKFLFLEINMSNGIVLKNLYDYYIYIDAHLRKK